jgi:NTP pyrophosphatase (non-canonical NTP hydrolase)
MMTKRTTVSATDLSCGLGWNTVQRGCHAAASKAGWWKDVDPHAPFVVPAKLCLIHSEISEAMEGHRKGLQDDKLPHRSMLEVELADAVIRIADLAGALDLDVGGAIAEKMAFNRDRADHKPENRAKAGGKTY